MSRIYTKLECGCLVSCDGGGGLIPGCVEMDTEGYLVESLNCKVSEYFKEHKMNYGVCKKCSPDEYRKEVLYARKNRRRK